MELTALNGMCLSNSFPQNSVKPVKEKVQRVKEPEGMEDTKRVRFSKLAEQSSYEFTGTEASRGPAQVCIRYSVHTLYSSI